jgi:flagella basal body P-ring formation protein FlgA
MTRLTLSLITLFTLCVCAQSALAAGKVSFFAQSKVSGERIALDDIARLEGISDGGVKARLRSVDLGKAPRPTASRTLSRSSIESALRMAGLSDTVRFVFPKKITVERPGQRLSADEVSRRAHAATVAAISGRWGKGYKVNVAPVKTRSEVVLPEGDVNVSASIREPRPAGPVMVRVTFTSGAGEVERQISARVTVTGPVCKARHDIERGQTISTGDLLETRSEIKRDAMRCAALVGQSPRSLIRADTVLRAGLVQAPKVVKRGDRVTIVYQSGALRITAHGEAMRDGAEGDWITVVNNTSKKVIKARVQAAGSVRIQ